jgi:hypothetical protein
MVQQYIDFLQSATLESSGMQPDDIDNLRHPDQENAPLVELSPLMLSKKESQKKV